MIFKHTNKAKKKTTIQQPFMCNTCVLFYVCLYIKEGAHLSPAVSISQRSAVGDQADMMSDAAAVLQKHMTPSVCVSVLNECVCV